MLSFKVFQERANEIHKNYSYIEPMDFSPTSDVSVKCPTDSHDNFKVTVGTHLYQKQGCSCIKGETLSKGNFIKRVPQLNFQYDCSKTVFVNSRTKVIITCDKEEVLNSDSVQIAIDIDD